MKMDSRSGITGSINYPMKIKIEFTLPDNDQEYDDFKNGPYYRAILTDFKTHIRNISKHGTKDGPAPKEVEELYRYFCELLSSYNLEL